MHTAVSVGLDRVAGGGHRVYHLLLWLNVHRHGLRVAAVLNGLWVRSVHVTVSTGRDGDRSRNWVLHWPCAIVGKRDRRIKRSVFRGQHPMLNMMERYGKYILICENECLGGGLVDNDGRGVGHGQRGGRGGGRGERRKRRILINTSSCSDFEGSADHINSC